MHTKILKNTQKSINSIQFSLKILPTTLVILATALSSFTHLLSSNPVLKATEVITIYPNGIKPIEQIVPTTNIVVGANDSTVVNTVTGSKISYIDTSTTKKDTSSVGSILSVLNTLKSVTNKQDSNGFNAGYVINDQDVYSLSTNLNSPDKIRQYLKSKGSFLADYYVNVDFESDDDMANSPLIKPNLSSQIGTKISFADLVWRLSRTNFGSSCSLANSNICINIADQPINPAIILSLIQRESGLIYGKNANLDPNSDEAKFLLERATGYYCLESNDKAKTCYDQNPEWRYYKGLFRQVYYGTRMILLNAKKCQKNIGWFGGNYKIGGIITVDDQDIKLESSLACSLYVYTPHISAQKSIYKVFKEING